MNNIIAESVILTTHYTSILLQIKYTVVVQDHII